MRSSASCHLRVLLALLCLAGCFLLTYLLVPSYIDSEIRRRIRSYVTLRPGAAQDAYERFIDSADAEDSVYYTKFYFFNITNLDDVRQKGSKPNLREVGPYTYRTVEQKYDVAFYWNGSVSYKERTFYYREPEMTVGDFDDVVVTLNLALVGVLDRLFDEVSSWFLQRTLSRIASAVAAGRQGTNSGLFLTRSVEELLWGYDDPILSTISRFMDVSSEFSLMQNGTAESDGSDDSSTHTLDSMINSGLMDSCKTGEFETWNGVQEVQNWNGYNETVRGTAGTFFHPFLTREEALSIWVEEMYRTMPLRKESTVNLFGILMYRYRIDPVFWQPDSRYYGEINGLVNITQFSNGGERGPPLYFSLPHFCGADPALTANVTGLDCRTEDHDFFIDVEPNTGVTLRAAVRLMISTEYSAKFDAIDPDLNRTVLPVFWLEFYREATEAQIEPIRTDLYRALDIRRSVKITALALTLAFGVMTVLYLLRIFEQYLIQKHRRRAAATVRESLEGRL